MWPELPRCPNCQQPIDLQPLFEVVGRNRSGRLQQPAGLRCPGCRVKLKVSQPRIVIINTAAFLLMGAALLALGLEAQASGRHHISRPLHLLFLVTIGGYFLLEPGYAARSATLDKVNEGHALYLPLEPQDVTEELSDSELLDAIIENAANTPKSGSESPEWTCASCGKGNPGNFDVCWSCQKARMTD